MYLCASVAESDWRFLQLCCYSVRCCMPMTAATALQNPVSWTSTSKQLFSFQMLLL